MDGNFVCVRGILTRKVVNREKCTNDMVTRESQQGTKFKINIHNVLMKICLTRDSSWIRFYEGCVGNRNRLFKFKHIPTFSALL